MWYRREAHLLIDGDLTTTALALRRRDPDWRSEAFFMVEFTNILVASVAAKRMNLVMAERCSLEARSLVSGKLARVPHAPVLATAAQYRVSAYDARFLALAQQLGSRLVTEDLKLRSAAPALTQSLSEALARA
jgi:predicted nucleic acid-binding protein